MKKISPLLLLPLIASLASCGDGDFSTSKLPPIEIGDGTNEEEVLRLQEMIDGQDGIAAAETRGRVKVEASAGGQEGLMEVIFDSLEGIPEYLHNVDPESGETLFLPQTPGEDYDWSCYTIFLREPGEEGSVEGLLDKEDAERFLEESGAMESLRMLADPVEAGLVLYEIPELLYPYVDLEFPETGGYIFRMNTAGLEEGEEGQSLEVDVDAEGLVRSLRMEGQEIEADWGATFGTTNRLTGSSLKGPLSVSLAESTIQFSDLDPNPPLHEEISIQFEGETDELPSFLRGFSSLKIDGDWDPQNGRHGVYCEAVLTDGSSWLLYQDEENVELGHYLTSKGTNVEISMERTGWTNGAYVDERMNYFDRWINTIYKWAESPWEGCGTPNYVSDYMMSEFTQGDMTRAWYDGTPDQVRTRAWCSVLAREEYLPASYDYAKEYGGGETVNEDDIYEREVSYDWETNMFLKEETVWRSEETGWLLEEYSAYPEDGKVAKIRWNFDGFTRKTSL